MKKRLPKKVRRQQKSTLAAAAVAAVEQLENRQLLAAGAFVEAGGRLVVRGTTRHHTITITAKAGDKSKLHVAVNNSGWDFVSKNVKTIKVEAGNGNDKVQ